jgi:arabinogalactan oligomer/maltooligosaccharide transport system permease protein
LTQDLVYSASDDTFTSKSTGAVYADNGNGNYANVDKKIDVLYPGWRNVNFPQNFTGLIFDPELRGPFIRVLVWTVAFAFLSVLTTFALGLALAIAMDKPIRGRRIYRSILILPYAIPGFLSLLIWRGMFNQDFGIINRILVDIGLIETNIAWFDQAWTARLMVILVNLWLGFPYMYLISSGALQAIPSDLKEAAAIDGASSWQSFRMITLPLLLQILFPLLIASFAFNFNNFNMIYLLTGGGPRDELAGERAGATDILISYAYNTAISDPADQNFGLASAISLFMFLIVGVLSMWSLRRTKALEEF